MASTFLNKRTFIYIDAANIILAMKSLGYVVNFRSLFIYLSDRFRNVEMFYFTANFDFIMREELEGIGFKVISKNLYYQNKLKANCDVEIAHHMTMDTDFNSYDRLVLMSGDGDFSIVLDYAHQNKKDINGRINTSKLNHG